MKKIEGITLQEIKQIANKNKITFNKMFNIIGDIKEVLEKAKEYDKIKKVFITRVEEENLDRYDELMKMPYKLTEKDQEELDKISWTEEIELNERNNTTGFIVVDIQASD